MVQRYLCARSRAEASRALWTSGVVVFLQFAFFLLIGVGLFVFYQAFPPAVPFDRPDRVFVRFIVEQLPHGVIGLVAGAIFAAAMSTLSSSLNSSATAVVTDFYRPLVRRDLSPQHLLRVTRGFTLFFGLVQVLVAFGGPLLDQTVVEAVLTIAGFTTGITLGVFFLGIFTTRVGQQAALVGLGLGLATISAVAFGTRLAWPWYTLIGSLSTFGFGLAREPRLAGRAARLMPAPDPHPRVAPGWEAGRARALSPRLRPPLAAPAAAQDWHDAYRAGLAALARGDHARAAEALQRAVTLHPEPGRNVLTYGTNVEPRYFPYLRLAEARLALGQLDAAREALERSASWGTREPADERQALPPAWRRRPPAAPPPPPPPTPAPRRLRHPPRRQRQRHSDSSSNAIAVPTAPAAAPAPVPVRSRRRRPRAPPRHAPGPRHACPPRAPARSRWSRSPGRLRLHRRRAVGSTDPDRDGS